jgi:hypothetical protein
MAEPALVPRARVKVRELRAAAAPLAAAAQPAASL